MRWKIFNRNKARNEKKTLSIKEPETWNQACERRKGLSFCCDSRGNRLPALKSSLMHLIVDPAGSLPRTVHQIHSRTTQKLTVKTKTRRKKNPLKL